VFPPDLADLIESHNSMTHNNDAFITMPGQGVRTVRSATPGAQGSPHHCPLPVVFQGTFAAKDRKRHHVEACIEHAGDLSNWRTMGQAATLITLSVTDATAQTGTPDRAISLVGLPAWPSCQASYTGVEGRGHHA